MAITFEGFAVHSGNPTTSATLTIPATVVNGDIILVSTSNGGGTVAGTCTDNSGVGSWTQKAFQAGVSMGGSVFWKRITNQTSERGATITKGGQTDSTACGLAVYRGCVASGDPFDVTPVSESNPFPNNTQAGITTVTDGAMVCLDIAVTEDQKNPNSQSTTSPGVLTERYDAQSTGGADAEIAHASALKASAGATGAFTWTMDANHDTVSIGYALKPGAITVSGACVLSGAASISAAGVVVPGWGAPENLIATAVSTSQINLSWDEVTGASGYDVERNGVVIAWDVVPTAYQDTGLTASTSYTYRVRAVA